MEPVADGTRVLVETEMQVTGPAAQFGRGVLQDVSAKMMRRFAECLADEIAQAPAPAAPAPAAAPAADAVPSGQAGVRLPPGPAAAAAEAAARGTVAAAGAPSRSPASPPAADDVAAPARRRPTEDVLDLGEAGREAVLKRALPVLAGLAAAAVVAGALRRRGRRR
jgi:hypothetical protein